MELRLVDYVILGIYAVFVLAVSFALERRMRTSEDFFLSGGSLLLFWKSSGRR